MANINPYLFFNRNCEEVFAFYKDVFGGEYDNVSRYRDAPDDPNSPPIGEEDKDLIMNISLPISEGTLLMGSDCHPALGPVKAGSTVTLAYSADSKDQATTIFNKLADGGKVEMPITDMFWGSYFGMLTDKFGFNWMVSFG